MSLPIPQTIYDITLRVPNKNIGGHNSLKIVKAVQHTDGKVHTTLKNIDDGFENNWVFDNEKMLMNWIKKHQV